MRSAGAGRMPKRLPALQGSKGRFIAVGSGRLDGGELAVLPTTSLCSRLRDAAGPPRGAELRAHGTPPGYV